MPIYCFPGARQVNLPALSDSLPLAYRTEGDLGCPETVRSATQAINSLLSEIAGSNSHATVERIVLEQWPWNSRNLTALAVCESQRLAHESVTQTGNGLQAEVVEACVAALGRLGITEPGHRHTAMDFNSWAVATRRLFNIAGMRMTRMNSDQMTVPPMTASALRIPTDSHGDLLLDGLVMCSDVRPMEFLVDGHEDLGTVGVPCPGRAVLLSNAQRTDRWYIGCEGWWLHLRRQKLVAHGHMLAWNRMPEVIRELMINWKTFIVRGLRGYCDLNGGYSWFGTYCGTRLSRRVGMTAAHFRSLNLGSVFSVFAAQHAPRLPRGYEEQDRTARASNGLATPPASAAPRRVSWNWNRIPAEVQRIMDHDLTLHLEEPA